MAVYKFKSTHYHKIGFKGRTIIVDPDDGYITAHPEEINKLINLDFEYEILDEEKPKKVKKKKATKKAEDVNDD